MQLSCHIIPRNALHYRRAGNPAIKCANQHLSAVAGGQALGPCCRSVSFASYARSGMRLTYKGRAAETALKDRRRQKCRLQLKPSWPSACSPCSQLASRKSPWNPWSWKNRPWKSSKIRIGSASNRPNPYGRQLCPPLSKHSWPLVCSPSWQPASRKNNVQRARAVFRILFST